MLVGLSPKEDEQSLAMQSISWKVTTGSPGKRTLTSLKRGKEELLLLVK